MSFQFVINNAETLSINNRKMSAVTTARDGSVRVVTRGLQSINIEVKLPDGMRWSEIKDDIAAIEALDLITQEQIEIPYEGFEWYYGYQQPGFVDTYIVRCIQMPRWTIFARDQVSWDSSFIFVVEG